MEKIMNISLTLKSRNKKTGPIPVSTSSAETCPTTCPFKGNGCYAEGYPLKGRWDEVTTGKRGGGLSDFVARVAALPKGQFWRHNQAGDLPGDGTNVDRGGLLAIANANEGRRGFTYTHYDAIANKANRAAIATANALGFTVNLSANNLSHADELADLGIGPVATVLPHDFNARKTTTPKGRTVIQCPATYRDDVTCASCQLCQRQANRAIVGFPAHGISKKRATLAAASA
jgi:hypothetical protein